MAERKSFVFLFEALYRNLLESKDNKLTDVDAMIKLGFSPPSWKVWKPQLINYGESTPMTDENESCEHYVKYKKQDKNWFLESAN